MKGAPSRKKEQPKKEIETLQEPDLEKQEALRESKERQLSTSKAYTELSEKLMNSIQLTPGPNVNKPRVPRPQDTAYQEAVRAVSLKEMDEGQEEGSKIQEKDLFKIFSNLASALTETSKTDVSLPPKFYGDDDKWESWYKQ
jgi:hypothetical protein